MLTAAVQEHRLVTTRRARYYTIGGDGGEPQLDDVWVVLHGQGQRASVFLKYFESIAAPNRLIVAPEALNRHYIAPGASGKAADAEVGTTWMTRMDRENEIADYVDFLDAHGNVVGVGPAPPPGAAFVRRWAIGPPVTGTANALVLRVLARSLAADAAGARGARGEARLATVRARDVE